MRNQTQQERVNQLCENHLNNIINGFSNFTETTNILDRDTVVDLFADIRRGYCNRMGSDYAGLPDIWVCNMPTFMIAEPTHTWEINERGEHVVPPPTAIAVSPRVYNTLTDFVLDMVDFFTDDRYQNQEVFLYTITKRTQLNLHIDGEPQSRYVARFKKMVWGDDNTKKVWLKKTLKRHKFGTTY